MNELDELYGIAFGCPTCSRIGDCPFKEVEALSFKEKVNWINGLSFEKKKAIFLHHESCTLSNE